MARAARCPRWLPLVLCAALLGMPPPCWSASILSYPKLCPNQTTFYGQTWRTRSYDSDCVLVVRDNARRNGSAEIHLVVVGPFSGSIGDMMTMSEPQMLVAAQEIEDSALLSGFRIRFHLADSRCSANDGTMMTIRALTTPPQKHGVIGDVCSGACASVNVATQYFNLLQASPHCASTVLSVRTDYPYFIRMTPSVKYGVTAGYHVAKLLRWTRAGVVNGPEDLAKVGTSILLGLASADASTGAYNWTFLAVDMVDSRAAATATIGRIRQRDARVTILFAYEDMAGMLFCEAFRQGMRVPDYYFFLTSGWWNQDFMTQQQVKAGCTSDQMFSVNYGALSFYNGALFTEPSRIHGLSGRNAADLYKEYMVACAGFADGRGACNAIYAGHYYDSFWEYAWILHKYLVEEGRPYSSLVTPAGRERLFQIGLLVDFQGVTGRVRHFNGVDPVTPDYGGSIGDRDGNVMVRQLRSMPPMSFMQVGTWSPSGLVLWNADIVWSPVNGTLRLPCSGPACDFAAGWVPPDRTGVCLPGEVWTVQQGCGACERGRYGARGASQCLPCSVGTYSDATGTSACALCAPGTASKELGAVQCSTCDSGAYLAQAGGSECLWCGMGTYSDIGGATGCAECNASFTTASVASRTFSACTCGQGTYLPLGGAACEPCPRGLHCPFGSKAANLPTSASVPRPSAAEPYPEVPAGYYSQYGDPFSLYICESEAFCPGGLPESCAEHHHALACGKCADKYYRPGKGTCRLCNSKDSGPMIGTLVFGLALLGALLLYTMYDSGSQNMTQVTAVLALGQLVCAVQALGILAQLQLNLEEPISSVLKIGSLLAFDVDLLKIQCVLGKDSPTQNFLVRLLAGPAVALVLAILLQLRVWKLQGFSTNGLAAHVGLERYLNSLGLLMVMTYVPVTIAMLRPLHCTEHPNGLRSMDSNKAVLCWHSHEHQGLVAMSLVGLLCFPVALLSEVGVAVWRYPKLVAAGLGPQFLTAHRFLFARFKPEVFYWGFFYLLRNLALSLVPVVCPDSAVLQVTLLAGILLMSTGGEGYLLPWRTSLANVSEMASMFGLLLFMQVAAFFIRDEDGGSSLASGLLMAIFVGTVGVTFAIALAATYRYFRRAAPYTIFLSHHKLGAGSLARWFKLRISLVSRANVFLDSDELEELDLIVDTVAHQTKNLVVLLTHLTLTRLWCAAEVAAGFKANIKTIPVACCDFESPTEAFLQRLPDLWSPTDLQSLVQYGISFEDILLSYRELAGLSKVTFERFAAPDVRQEAVLEVLQRCGCATLGVHRHKSDQSVAKVSSMRTLSMNGSASGGLSTSRSAARIVVVSAPGDPEARSTCEVLKHLIEVRVQLTCAVVLQEEEAEFHRDSAGYLLIALTRGILNDLDFRAIVLTMHDGQASAHTVLALADTHFHFPNAEFFATLEASGEDQARLAAVLRRAFNGLALPFSPHGASSLMEAQVNKLCRRFKFRTGSDGRLVAEETTRRKSNPGVDAANSEKQAALIDNFVGIAGTEMASAPAAAEVPKPEQQATPADGSVGIAGTEAVHGALKSI